MVCKFLLLPLAPCLFSPTLPSSPAEHEQGGALEGGICMLSLLALDDPSSLHGRSL